jgi:hypothetical protein
MNTVDLNYLSVCKSYRSFKSCDKEKYSQTPCPMPTYKQTDKNRIKSNRFNPIDSSHSKISQIK